MKSRNYSKVLDVAFSIIAASGIFVIFGAKSVFAVNDAMDNISVSIPVSCSITGTVGSTHTATVDPGTYEDEIGETIFKVFCNDANGFAVYAIGYSDDTYGNTVMKPSTLEDTNAIATGTATSGSTSNWAMKLTAVSGTYAPTLENSFNTYHVVPGEYTKVASFASSTDATIGSSFKSTYAAFVSQAQPADTYIGKVKYTIVHPANGEAADYLIPMQNLDSSLCTTTPMQVRDKRDKRAYTIQRLADGNCWMMENLDLGRTDLTTDLSSANTNLATTVTAATFNSWKTTASTQTYDAGEFIPVEGTDETSGTPYGTLYNYYAATAGTVSGSANSNNASSDICPAGWRLPTGGSSGEFESLYAEYNSNALMRASIANNGAAFALAGFFSTGNADFQNRNGDYWTSTRFNNARVYYMGLTTGTVGTSGNNARSNGSSIRCILKDLIMQDVSSWGSSVEEGEEVIAKDARDGKMYTVARLADGNLWMTQNLDHDIDSTKTYTPADTDIPANWTPSASTHATNDTTWTGSTTAPESYDPGDKYWNGTTQDGSGDSADYISTTGDSHYHLGNYYNWTAVVAMNDSSSYNTTQGTLVDQSICPAGWTLPRAGYGEDTFYALINEYDTWDSSSGTIQNETQLWTGPTYFSLSGRWYGSFGDVGYSGDFWSPVVDHNSAYEMGLDSDGYVGPGIGYAHSHRGLSVRCVARPVASTVTFTEP